MAKPKNGYPHIDMKQTGKLLKRLIFENGYTVKEIQQYLELSCSQPVYRWMKGEILPSLDHMYALSRFFGIHMEEMIVPKQEHEIFIEERIYHQAEARYAAYYKYFSEKIA
ncbi:MAG: helix-turn-helix domain-containing protein [Lachnospiraceae bacterium]|nr:helix-turn-helix transcriptional regulator [Clostridiales bacterium]MDY4771627.1 helix-turn-helix transcriptional regulator [Lachnospiraceae bacterium]